MRLMVKEPGKTGSLWRIHYSLRWPTLKCDFFKLTPVEGKGSGESLRQYPLKAGDYVLADRGYCHATGIHYVEERQRPLWRYGSTPMASSCTQKREADFPLLSKLKPIQRTGQIADWNVDRSIRGPGAGRWRDFVSFAKPRPPSRWPRKNSDAKPANRARNCSPKP